MTVINIENGRLVKLQLELQRNREDTTDTREPEDVQRAWAVDVLLGMARDVKESDELDARVLGWILQQNDPFETTKLLTRVIEGYLEAVSYMLTDTIPADVRRELQMIRDVRF